MHDVLFHVGRRTLEGNRERARQLGSDEEKLRIEREEADAERQKNAAELMLAPIPRLTSRLHHDSYFMVTILWSCHAKTYIPPTTGLQFYYPLS